MFRPLIIGKDHMAVEKRRAEENELLIAIIHKLKQANRDYIHSYEASGAGGKKQISNREFRFSMFADTGKKFMHAQARAKDLELLLKKAEKLPFESLKFQLEAHLKIYQEQEKKDRGISKGKVQKMLDTAEKSLKHLSRRAPSPTPSRRP